MKTSAPVLIGRGGPLLVVLLLCVISAYATVEAQLAFSAAPIEDGESAAGIHLGASEADVMAAFGGPPMTVEELGGGRRDLVYVSPNTAGDSVLTIRISFTPRGEGAEAIHLVMARRSNSPSAYTGRTTRGYAAGQSAEVVRALYGFPDVALPNGTQGTQLFWYRDAGLLIAPGESFDGEWYRTRIIVVNQFVGSDDVAHLVRVYYP